MTPEQVYQLIYMLYGMLALETLLLLWTFFKTPALTFLKASLFKFPLIYIMGKDHMGIFRTFKRESGAAKVGKEGLFHLTENSHTLEMGSKIPIYFAFRDLAATLLPEYPAIIQELRESGFIANDLEDIKIYLNKIKSGMEKTFPIKVKQFKTYKFHELANMFPNNLDPSFIDSTVQCEVSKFTRVMKIGPMAMMGIVTLLIVASVAVFIVQKAFKGQMSASDCSAMVSAAKCAAQAVATVSVAPIVP